MSERASESSMGREPVIVVGAGPVGLAGALLLARQGVPSVVLEALPVRSAIGSRSICVQRDVLDILERVGLGQVLVDAGVTWYTGRIYYREREVSTITFPETGPGDFPPFVNISQSDVEVLLENQVRASPLIDLRYGHRVVDLSHDDAGVSLVVSTVDGTVTVRGTHCLAADGARSAVRELLGLPFEGQSFADQFLITDIRTKLDFPVPERHFHFDPPVNPGRQVLLHPQPDSVWRIDWQVPADYDLEADRAGGGLDRRIRAIVGDAPYEPVWLSVYRSHQRRVPTMRVGRVLLAGDAAHLMTPFGARGMNSGISDAENAAWKIALDRSGAAGPALLASYDAERSAAAIENLRVTGDTMRFLVPANDAERAHRRSILERSRTDPAARKQLDSGKLAEPFWYLDSPLTTPGDPARLADFPTAPATPRPVVPGTLCPNFLLGPHRLRSLFAPGFTLLTGPATPTPTLDLPTIPLPLPIAGALTIAPAGAALLRPDAYLAALLPTPTAPTLQAALHRAQGW